MKDIFSSNEKKNEFENKTKQRYSYEPDNYSPSDARDNVFRSDFLSGDDRCQTASSKEYSLYPPEILSEPVDDRADRPFYGYTYSEGNGGGYEIPHEPDNEPTRKPLIQKPVIQKPREKKPKGNSKIKKGKIVAAIIAIILIICIGLSCFAFALCSKVDSQPDTHKKNEFISDSELMSSKSVYNILVLGTDERESQANFRSDSMILVSLDKKTNKIKLTSFLRDSYVYIPEKGYSTKLNAACSYGGPQMVIDTIEYNFKIHIDKYVMINFDIFKTIIHDLGGVTLTMTEEEAACIRRESGYKCKAGTHTYKAKIALWYARIRHIDSDFKRTERQRKVIVATASKLMKSKPSVVISMLNDVLPMIQTDMTPTELFSVGMSALPLMTREFGNMEIPEKGSWSNATINGQAVLKLDIEQNTMDLHEFIYGK